MAHVQYEFSAAWFPPRDVVMCVTTNNVAVTYANPEARDAVWSDILRCFSYGGWSQVAAILEKLPYTQDSVGTFSIAGAFRQRQQIFHILAPHYDQLPGVRFSVLIKFFRSDLPPNLVVHHWVGRFWQVDRIREMPPSSVEPTPTTVLM